MMTCSSVISSFLLASKVALSIADLDLLVKFVNSANSSIGCCCNKQQGDTAPLAVGGAINVTGWKRWRDNGLGRSGRHGDTAIHPQAVKEIVRVVD